MIRRFLRDLRANNLNNKGAAMTAIQHLTSVDQSDRLVPYNLRQSGATPMEMLIFTRVRKSPFWHLSVEAGAWRATIYNRIYHPFGYVRHEDGGPMVEYRAIKEHVTLWNVAVERQIMVKGTDAEAFVDYVITRDATKISPMRARYVILCNPQGGVLNDPVLLRLSKDEFWFSLADSDIGMYLQGVNSDGRFDVLIDEIDVSPLQIQGPKSIALMKDLVGDQVDIDNIPFYGLAEVKIAGHSCVISQTGFSGEAGFEVYLRDSTLHAEDVWYEILAKGKSHQLMVTAPPHCRRIQAGILSWGQDMDHQHNPFQCNLGYQVSLSGKGEWNKQAPYVGKEALEAIRDQLRAGEKPYKLQLVGLQFGGKPIEDFAPDFWPVSHPHETEPCGFITSPWFHPELQNNIAMAYVPYDGSLNKHGFPTANIGQEFRVHLPDEYLDVPGSLIEAEVVPMPFTQSHNPNTREAVSSQ